MLDMTAAAAATPIPTNLPKYVTKRSGDIKPFEEEKIKKALTAAWVGSGGTSPSERDLARIINKVWASLVGCEMVSVEDIQDAVEVSLMASKKFEVAKAFILHRQQRAEARQKRTEKKPDTKALSSYIHAAKYAKYLPELQRREVAEETTARVEAMHIRKFPQLEDRIRKAFDLVREDRVLPSMRSLQFGGVAIEKINARIYNCSATLIDRMEAFSQAFFLLLCGCGVGFSVQMDHVEKLPTLSYIDKSRIEHCVIEDTIEGWADAAQKLLDSYLSGTYIEFSYHKIRPEGSPLVVSGGKAPGHRGLKVALERVREILDRAQGRKMRPVECHRIMCHLADAVLSGGVRRSSLISLFSFEDSEMLYLKTGNWFPNEPWLANANNSVVLKRDDVKKKQFKKIFQMTRQWGEPGFYFTNSYDYATNPCVPGGTRILTREGYFAIESLVNKEVEVWNGKQWSKVTPQITGYNQPMVRVHLSDGTSLDCTDYHEWVLAGGEKVKAKDLVPDDSLEKFNMPIVEAGEDLHDAYTHGFWCGDGTTEDGGRKTTYLYGIKRGLLTHLNVSRTSEDDGRDRTRAVLPKDMPEKYVVPINNNITSKLKWLAGLLDSDGSVQRNPNSPGLQISSVNLSFLKDIRLMLTTLGVQSKIGIMRTEGERFLPDGKGGIKKYPTQEGYRLLINAQDTHHLVTMGLKTHRLDLEAAKEKPQRDARRFVKVRAIEKLNNADTVYCFNEPLNHTGTFEGVVTGQCAEIGLNPVLVVDELVKSLAEKKGIPLSIGERYTGFSFCNLCELNASKFTSLEDFLEAASAATFIGTLQASYTDLPYLGWVSELIAERDALLGIGMTGIMDAPEIALNPEYQRIVANKVKEWNAEVAKLIGIQPAARTTTVKPSGTSSLRLGCVGSGIHFHHGKRYFRRVTANENEPVFQYFRKQNPHMCVRKPNGDSVIEFVVEAPEGAKLKTDYGAIEFLDMVKSTQVNWVQEGTARTEHSPGLSHNVSNTVEVKPEEWDKVCEYLWDNRDCFTGVSFLPSSGDKDYAFAPMERISTPGDEARWNAILENYTPVDYSLMVEEEDTTNLKGEGACIAGACEVK